MTEARDNIIALLKCALRQDDIDLGIDGYALPVKYKGQETVLAVRRWAGPYEAYEAFCSRTRRTSETDDPLRMMMFGAGFLSATTSTSVSSESCG